VANGPRAAECAPRRVRQATAAADRRDRKHADARRAAAIPVDGDGSLCRVWRRVAGPHAGSRAKRVKLYGCASHWKRGPRVCSNGLVGRVEVIDAEVIATLAEDVLRPTVIDQALAFAFEDLAPAGTDRTRRQLEAELTKVTDECGRLAEAIGRGGRLTALLDRLTRLDARAGALRAELTACPAAAPTFDRKALEQRLHVKLTDWRGLLTRNVATGNAMLRTLLAEPIRFTPVVEERRRGYRFEGRIALDRMITGLVPLPEISAKLHHLGSSPAGIDTCRLRKTRTIRAASAQTGGPGPPARRRAQTAEQVLSRCGARLIDPHVRAPGLRRRRRWMPSRRTGSDAFLKAVWSPTRRQREYMEACRPSLPTAVARRLPWLLTPRDKTPDRRLANGTILCV